MTFPSVSVLIRECETLKFQFPEIYAGSIQPSCLKINQTNSTFQDLLDIGWQLYNPQRMQFIFLETVKTFRCSSVS